MKRLIAGVIAVLFILGCTTATTNLDVSVDKGRIMRVETQAKYYETVYWGEDKTMKRSNITYIGRDWKTQQIYPTKDMPFVLENNVYGPYDINLVWYSRDHETNEMGLALGMCFDNPETKATTDYCGVIIFNSAADMLEWITEFKGMGENVEHCVDAVYASYAIPYLEELESQIEESKDRVIGE